MINVNISGWYKEEMIFYDDVLIEENNIKDYIDNYSSNLKFDQILFNYELKGVECTFIKKGNK